MNIQRALEGAGDLSVHPSVSALHIPASHAFIPFQHFSGISVPESVARSRPDDNNNKTVVSVVAAVSGLCPALPVVSMQHQSQIPQAVVATPAIIPAVVAPVAVQTTGTFAPGSGPSEMGSIGIANPQPSGSGIALTCSIGNPAIVSENNIAAVGSASVNTQKSPASTSPPSNKSIITSGISAANIHTSANVSGSNSNNSGGSSSPAKTGKVNSSTNSSSSAKISNSTSSSSHNLTQEQTDDLVKPVFRDGELVLEVECGQNKGILYLSKLCQGSKGPCISFQNSWLTPNEFQFVSGRETAKDWKRSIRHHGKSLKLLLAKGILNVHPTMCDCDGCRQGATLTRKGEKRRIPNGERKIRKPSNNNNNSNSNNNNNTGINGNITNGANSNHNSSSHNNSSSSSSNNNNNNNSKLPASGGPENPASGTFRPMGSAIVPCQLSPGGAAAKPDVKRPGVDKAPKVADTLPRFTTDLASACPVFPSSKASLLPVPPHGLMVNANIGNQGAIAAQSSSASIFSPINISPTTSASSSSSPSPSPTSSTTPQPLSLSMPTVSLPFSSSASSLLFSSGSKPNQPVSLFSLSDVKNGDNIEQASLETSTLSPNAKERLEEEGKTAQNADESTSPDAIKSCEVDEQSCDEDDDLEEDESPSKICVKDDADSKEKEIDEKMEEDAEAVSDSEDCVETNGEDIAKSDVSFESSDEDAEVSENSKQAGVPEDFSKCVGNILRENQETVDNDSDIREGPHLHVPENQNTSGENRSRSPPVTQSNSDANLTLPYSSSVPSQPILSTLSSPASLATVMSSATMSVSSLAGTCSQTASATAPNNVKSEHIWVPPTLTHTRDSDKEQSHSSSSVSSSISVKTEGITSAGGSRGIQHPVVSSHEESKIFSTRNPPIHHKVGKEGEFNFRSVRELCAPLKKESPDAKLLSPALPSHNSEKNRDRERDKEREREREEKQRQRLREERNRKDKEREERREKERREERERESERRRAEERRDHGRSQSEIGNKHDAPSSSVTSAMNLDPLRRPPGGASDAAAFSDYMRVLAASHGNAFLPPSPAAYMQPMLSLRPPDPRMASQLLSPLAASYTSSLGGIPKDPLLYPGTSSMMSGLTPPGLPQIHPFLQRPPYTPSQPSVLDYQRSLASAAAYPWPSPYSYLIPDLGAASAAAAAAAAASTGLKRPSSELEAAMDLNAKRMRLEGRQTELGSHWDYLAAAAAAQRPQMPSLPCGLESANMDKTTEYLRKRYMEYGPQAAYLSALPEYARTMYHCACAEHRDDDIRLWNVEDVCKFLSSLDGCAIYADHFREQRVDGRILALLSTDHLMKTLGMKLGPAVLLYEAVAKKLQEISKMANCEACRNIALSQPLPPMALPL